ncbi:MAG: hypothetical protein HW416_3814, partial [Chloroflexi bacterium]|nr:hypothetical protein [Chloroflexota bacterium]
LRDLCRSFAGQRVAGRRFGSNQPWIVLPHVSTVSSAMSYDAGGSVLGKPADIELDLRFGDDQVWLGEVRRRAALVTVKDILLAQTKAEFIRHAQKLLPGPTWVISMSGFSEGSRLIHDSSCVSAEPLGQ